MLIIGAALIFFSAAFFIGIDFYTKERAIQAEENGVVDGNEMKLYGVYDALSHPGDGPFVLVEAQGFQDAIIKAREIEALLDKNRQRLAVEKSMRWGAKLHVGGVHTSVFTWKFYELLAAMQLPGQIIH
jgi:hypothetical protein